MAASPPDAGIGTPPLLRLGRLLPASLRERIFEPAYFDLLADRQRGGSSNRFGLRVLLLALETYRVGTPGLVWGLRRASRWVFLALFLAACGVAIAVFVITGYE